MVQYREAGSWLAGNLQLSIKDRMALAMIEAAESDERIQPKRSVVEYIARSTGVSLALVCAVQGHRLQIVTSDAFAREKLDHMRFLGARMRTLESESGRMTEMLTRDMVEKAREFVEQTGAFLANQLSNPALTAMGRPPIAAVDIEL